MKNTGIYFGIVFCCLLGRTAGAQTCTGAGTLQVLVENCSATSELTASQFSISPNPAREVLTLKNDGNPVQVEFVDLLGRVVWVKKLDGFATTQVDVSAWPAGIYTVCWRSERLLHAYYSRIEILR
jgi:hypothetical protein